MVPSARHTLAAFKMPLGTKRRRCEKAVGVFFHFRDDPVPDPFHAAVLPRSSSVSNNPQSLKGHRELIKNTNG